MKETNGRLKDRILLSLKRSPSHGYDLLKTLEKHDQTLITTTLYRWLHQMESSGLVASEVHPSPHGPPRRVYRVGEKGESRLREMMRDAMEIILFFYEEQCHRSLGCLSNLIPDDIELFSGRVLFSSCARITGFDAALLNILAKRCNGSKIHILGDVTTTSVLGIPHRLITGELTEMHTRSGKYSLVWLNGVPENEKLPLVLAEIRRVLADNGSLIMTAPITFFDEPQTPSLDSFVRFTSVELFPDLSAREERYISMMLEEFFPHSSVVEVVPEFAIFFANKGKRKEVGLSNISIDDVIEPTI